MKKISKTVMGFVLGILVAFTLDVAAETLIDSGAVSYSNSKTSETTVDGALDELFSAIDISKQIGDMTKIATIGDGTITGAINTLNTSLQNVNNSVSELNSSIDKKLDVLVNVNTDPNNIKITSVNLIKHANAPIANRDFVIGVIGNGSFCIQIAQEYTGYGTNNVYVRNNINGIWTVWKLVT